ncbi:MAG: LacI family DNA-binding transcriptional regulator [Victivallaceae bacterium]
MSKVTLKDIARDLNISYATVSFALKDDPRIAAKTKVRVQEAAKRHNYIANHVAQALQSRKSMMIGCLIADVTQSYVSELLQSFGEVASANNYSILLGLVKYSAQYIDAQLKTFCEKRVDGIITTWIPLSGRHRLSEINSSGTPVVACSSLCFESDIPFISNDDFEGCKIAVRHLAELGHKRIAYGCLNRKFGRDSIRYDGYCNAVKEIGIAKPLSFQSEAELAQLLESENCPTGIVAFSDYDAIFIKHFLDKKGLKIPDDISLLGFDDIWAVSQPEYNFSTIAIKSEEIGRQAMEMLLERINGHKVENRLIKPELIIRGSTARI